MSRLRGAVSVHRPDARLLSVDERSAGGHRTFIDDFVEFVVNMPELMRHGRGAVEADPIFLHMDVDDQLIKRIFKQVKTAAKGLVTRKDEPTADSCRCHGLVWKQL
jgi:hypothetical protein